MRRKQAKRRKDERRSFIKWLILILSVIGLVFVLFLFKPKYWNLGGKFTVVKNAGDKVIVSLYDTTSMERIDILIPPNTQVLTASGFGTWKLGSLWKLGKDENLGGTLITRSIAKNFGFPVVTYWDNLSVGDKLRIKWSDLWGSSHSRTIDLGQTVALKKTQFVDGEKGYLVAKNIPEDIGSLFSDQEYFGSQLKAKIIDSSGTYDLADKVGEIIETMGIKLAVISKDEGSDFDCKVGGKNIKLATKLSLILGCKEKPVSLTGGFDLEVSLGEKFPQQF